MPVLRRTGMTLDFRKFLSGVQFASRVVREAATQGMGESAMQLLNDCVTEPPTVPHKTGRLRASGSVIVNGNLLATGEQLGFGEGGTPATDTPTRRRRGEIEGVVAFNTPYAARLHEHPEYQFTEPGSGGKYLETKIAAHYREYLGHVADKIKGALG